MVIPYIHVFFLQLPPSANNGIVSLDHGSEISLFEKIIEKEITVNKNASVIAGTQEDVSRKLSFQVSCKGHLKPHDILMFVSKKLPKDAMTQHSTVAQLFWSLN